MTVVPATVVHGWHYSTPIDISDYVQSVSITRGRNSVLDDMHVGTCVVQAYNRNSDLDPLNTSSPLYYSAGHPMTPGALLDVTASGEMIFYGLVSDVEFSYTAGGVPMATITVEDRLAELAKTTIGPPRGGPTGYNPTAGEWTGDRITGMITEYWGFYHTFAIDHIDAGEVTLQADFVPIGTNLLAYVQLVARTELGRFFANRNGLNSPPGAFTIGTAAFTFKQRTYAGSPALTLSDSHAPGTILYNGVGIARGRDSLFSQVIVSRVGGSTETFVDEDAAAIYGVISTESAYTGLLYEDDAQSYDAGLVLITAFATDAPRFRRFGLNMGRLSPTDQVQVMQLDLAAEITAEYTPKGMGAIAMDCIVEGIQHDITPESHTVELFVSTGFS